MKETRSKATGWSGPTLNRRSFLKVGGAFASAAVAGPVFHSTKSVAAPVAPTLVTGQNEPDRVESAEDIIFSVCQMCHSRCGIRAKVQDGVLVKIDGNPYHPNNRDVDENGEHDRLAYGEDPSLNVEELGRVCLKGQAGVQTLYDPLRIRTPLKRVGTRNSGQWEPISWDQAFQEIAARINELIPDRDAPIDPDIPELGTKRNQLAFAPGRSVEKEMSERIWKHAWGTANYGLSHTSVCESTRHVANELITWDPAGNKNSKGAGRTEGWQTDILGAEYIIFFGANPLEADFPMVGMARNLMHFKRNGGRYVVVDPRFNNTAAKANQWVPITPGTDAALAMAMIQLIIDNGADTNYLAITNQAAAAVADPPSPTWTDATYLVGTFTDGDGREFQRYVTAGEFGIANGTTVSEGDNVVWVDGLKGHLEVDRGTLDVTVTETTVDGVDVELKSAFTLLKESAFSRSIDQYAAICDVPVGTVMDLASEFVSHGKKAVAMTYRGPIKHTNGLHNQLAIQHLNTLIGNYDWKGGCTAGAGGWGHKSGMVSLSSVDGDPGARGIRIDRAKTFYDRDEAGILFEGYPARRPWFPFGTHGNYQEVIPSIQDQYPYPVKALITYWNAWPYSVPALRRVWEQTLSDENTLPLLVAISPVIGEVAAWADYVLPDTVYLEKFAVPGVPWRVNKGTAFQRPVVGAFDGVPIGVRVADGGLGNTIPVNGINEYTPYLPDTKAVLDIQIGLAKALGLPGVGTSALLDATDTPVGDLHNGWDWAKAMLENIAASAQAEHPGITIDEILAKGGVFDNPGEEYDGELLNYRYGNIIRTFADPVAHTRDSVTGDYYSGVAQYQPIVHSDGVAVSDSDYPYRLITFKTVQHGQARTNVNPWLMLMAPENFVEISARDAADLEVETGDPVRVSSASHREGIVGKAKVTQGLKPGVVAISHHYGHWEQHSRPIIVDGVTMPHDPSRGAGLQPTQIMRTDRRYGNVSLQEPIGASCSFYDTSVRVQKV
jgi:anaerobic selenocysteine-containing dehydrogenase